MHNNASSIFCRTTEGNKSALISANMKRTKLTPSTPIGLNKLTTTPVSRKNTTDLTDENSKPLSTPRNTRTMVNTCKYSKTKSTNNILQKGNDFDIQQPESATRTPLASSTRLNRTNLQSNTKTPTTPKRAPSTKRTPTKTRTPFSAKHSLLVEFNDDIFVTPLQDLNNAEATPTSVSVTSSLHIEAMPYKTKISPSQLNRSHSASSINRHTTGGTTSTTTTTSSSRIKDCTLRRSRSEARINTTSCQNSSSTGSSNNLASNLQDGEASRLTVGVRVRPLHPREHGNAVFVSGNEVSVASELGSVHKFTYDHCFGSSSPNCATQADIFESMVRPLLETAFQGYNACLFAYGQTGSGKTYSMMGPLEGNTSLTEQSGIIPRFCCELLKQTAQLSEGATAGSTSSTPLSSPEDHPSTVTTVVEISYLEVYNEKIHDLLVPGSSALRVREHPLYGPYVADLSKHVVNTVDDFQKWLDYGNKKRATAATEMNDKSSRSHTLFTVILTQTFVQLNLDGSWSHEQSRRSQINLVDLAGSERIAHSVASSDRIREGVSINRSLLTLGKVMSALVERRSFVPYRESVLTWLLKDSLGGNSRTSMLATISPCSSHLEETLSTLRYASQARSIVNTVRINEGPQDRLIRELKAEVERLNSEMEKNRCREVNVQSSSEEVENLPSEEVEKLRKETVEAKVQVEMMNNETFRYQQQMTNIMKQNDHLSEQVYEKNKQLDESKIQIETLNKELKPMNALLSATQNELQENVNKIDLLNKEIAQLQSSHEEFKQKYQDLIKRNNDLEEKLNLQQSENDKVFSKKKELIENLKSENNLLKNDLNTARNELHQMKSIIDDKIVLSKDEKLEMDSKLKNKDEDLCLTKEKNEKLKVDLKQAHSDIKKLQSKINEERKKVESFDKLSKELDQIKDENKQLKEKVHKGNNLQKHLHNLETEKLKQIQLIEKKNKEIIELKSDKEVLEKNLFNANEKLINTENQLDKNKQTSLENIQLIKEYEQEIQKLKDENNSLDTNLKNIDVKLQKTKNLIDENNKNSNAINLENEKLILEKDKEIKNIKEENIFYRNESAKALEQINDLKKQLEELSEQGKMKSKENDKLKKEIEKYAKEIKAMKNDYKILEEKHSKAVKDLENVHLQDKTVSENTLQQKNIEIDKLLKENESLKSELNQLKEKCNEITTELNRTNEKIEKEKLKVIEEKMNEIKTLKEDNSLLKKQQCSTRDELLKALSIIEQKSHKLEVLENEKQQIIDDKCKIVGQLQLEITELHNAIDTSNNKLRNIENNLLLETNRKVELEDKLRKLENKFKALEEDKTILESRVKNAEHLRQNLQTELSWMAGERSFSEYQIETNKNKDKIINEKEEKISQLEMKYEKVREEKDYIFKELNDLKQNLNVSLTNENLFQSEIHSHKKQLEAVQAQLKNAQKLNEELMEEKLTIIKVMEKQCMEQEELKNQKEIVAQNSSLKKDLAFSKEKILKKTNKIERLQKKVIDLEDLLKKIVHDKILIHQKEASFKHAVMMKDVEVYGFITDNLYPHHWEHLTRKARDYAEKYKIPYEFEKGEDCVIVRHLMLSASTTLNHFQFNQWLEKIEKNNLWFREMDKDWPWEVDFRDYFTHESDKPLEFVDNDDKAINIGISKSKNGFLDPVVWRDTMLRRHVRGIREDVDALIVHFSSTEDSLIYSILSRLKAAADRLEEVTVNRNLKK